MRTVTVGVGRESRLSERAVPVKRSNKINDATGIGCLSESVERRHDRMSEGSRIVYCINVYLWHCAVMAFSIVFVLSDHRLEFHVAVN